MGATRRGRLAGISTTGNDAGRPERVDLGVTGAFGSTLAAASMVSWTDCCVAAGPNRPEID